MIAKRNTRFRCFLLKRGGAAPIIPCLLPPVEANLTA
jgi:hypothetical protein